MKSTFSLFLLLSLFTVPLSAQNNDIPIFTLEGQKLNLADLTSENQYTVIAFWASWCKPCIQELNAYNKNLAAWKDEYDLGVIALSIDDSRSQGKVIPIAESNKWNFDVFTDPNREAMRAFNFQFVPSMVIVDNKGNIVYKHTQYKPGDEALIPQHLSEIATGEVEIGSPFSGSLRVQSKLFVKDSAIGAVTNPQFENEKVGTESWLDLNYREHGFDIGVRFDLFANSNLLNPEGSYTESGIGRFYAKKQFNNTEIAGGYLYGQIGKGFIYRSFEDRNLGIDNALLGVSASHTLLDDKLTVKGFWGSQKGSEEAGLRFSTFNSEILGGSAEFFFNGKNVKYAPGVGFVNRTLDNDLLRDFRDFGVDDVNFNQLGLTYFHTLTAGAFNWYFESATKSNGPTNYPDFVVNGTLGENVIFQEKGSLLYSSLNFNKDKVGIVAEAKRVDNFQFRSNPFDITPQSAFNYIAPINKINTYALTAFYPPATQEYEEQSFSLDATYKASDALKLNYNTSFINNFRGTVLFREYNGSANYLVQNNIDITGGLQVIKFNQAVYQEPVFGFVNAVVPYIDIVKNIDTHRSIKVESQFLSTDDDEGNWFFTGLTYNATKNLQVYVSDNINLGSNVGQPTLHYWSGVVSYNQGPSLLQVGYNRQREGLVCSGGICRVEPAFSGAVFNLTTNF